MAVIRKRKCEEWLCLILVCVCVCVFVFWCANNSLFGLLYAGTCGLGSHGTNSEHKQQETYFSSSVNLRQTFVFSSVYIA
jgi:hypothetical protein